MNKSASAGREDSIKKEKPAVGLLGRLTGLNLRFTRYFREAAGVVLIAFSLMALLAQAGITRGAVLTPLARLVSLSFGWGGYLFIFGLGYGGFILLRREPGRLVWGRFFALELAALLSLGLLALLAGTDVSRIETGQGGGAIGWGLVRLADLLVGKTWGVILLITLWLLAVMTGFGFWRSLENWLVHLAGEPALHAGPSKGSLEAFQPLQGQPAIESKKPDIQTADDLMERLPTPKPALPARKSKAAALPPEFRTSLGTPVKKGVRGTRPIERDDRLPPLSILLAETEHKEDERTINQTAGLIMKTLAEFGIPATVIGYRVGPAVTQFAVQPGFIKKPGMDEEDSQQMKVRVAQIASLEKDLALALSAERLRIEAPVPGKPYVGIEVPNTYSTVVRLKSLLESEAFNKSGAPLTIALGRDVSGQPVLADLARMPHLLIAGATGSGKSVCITSMAASLAMNNSPEDLRMVMIDSKMVELLRFNGLPHIYGKVETNLERILGVLRWVVVEMEHRYRLLEASHSRDIESYNRKLARKPDGVALPRIVVMIDELADLMMSAPDQTEHNLVRLAQMARATGIHLVVATQRPSTDVVTGLIKANFPARLAFAVASGVDSRVILDSTGAETLLGRGDLLFLNPEAGNPIRAQGVMVADMEIERIVSHWQKSSDAPLEEVPPWERLLQEPAEGEDDDLMAQAIEIVRQSRRASASLIQRRLRIGYPRAARLLDQLEELGVVGPSQGGGREREVLPFEEEPEE